ncbi:MAG: biosynthetic-type acetolactate synthase large subunit [Lachnospirales bacterium]
MELTGADILIECLVEQKVDKVFGYPGGAVLNIYDALYKNSHRIKHYLTSHEQGASHAADGYARSTGKVGVCIATSGPGATNLVTGIATAYMDSVPMVAITGNVAVNLLGKDSFQEVDISGIVMPITKHSFIVKDVKDLAKTIRKAFSIARSGRPGPVLVDITKDVTIKSAEYIYEEPKYLDLKKRYNDQDIQDVVNAISYSKKPFIYGGGGVITSDCHVELEKFSKLIDAPICLSLMGKGGIDIDHEYYTGMVGMHGTKASNVAMTECDLLIAMGARFSDRVVSNVKKFAPNAKILHIDIDPVEINKNVYTFNSIIGDLKEILTILLEKVERKNNKPWIDYILKVKENFPLRNDDLGELKPWHIFNGINELVKGDAIFATEVGQHQMWASQYVKINGPRKFLTSGGLGTMGYGLGAAIGAQAGNPDSIVFNIAGDGCFRMNHIEIATAVEYELPIIEVVFNNHALGMVRQWQNLFYDKRYSQTHLSDTTDFMMLAKAYKADGYNITKPSEVIPTFKKAIENRRPCIINCEIHNDEKVFPMVAPGAGIDEIVVE